MCFCNIFSKIYFSHKVTHKAQNIKYKGTGEVRKDTYYTYRWQNLAKTPLAMDQSASLQI